jgi:hypothetical protein
VAGHGRAAVGIDLSAGMVAAARRAYPDTEFREGDFLDLPARDGEFGAVVAFYSIIHRRLESLPRLSGRSVYEIKAAPLRASLARSLGFPFDSSESPQYQECQATLTIHRLRTRPGSAYLVVCGGIQQMKRLERPADSLLDQPVPAEPADPASSDRQSA